MKTICKVCLQMVLSCEETILLFMPSHKESTEMFQNHVSSNPDSVKGVIGTFRNTEGKALRDVRDSDMRYRHALKYVNILWEIGD